jgi:hypothetical protein
MKSVVKSRLRRWENGEHAALLADLAECEAAFARREGTFRTDEAEREKRVERKVSSGETSKALQAAAPPAPFSGLRKCDGNSTRVLWCVFGGTEVPSAALQNSAPLPLR